MTGSAGEWIAFTDADHSMVNEIDVDDNHGNSAAASITATTGTNWADPTYDAAGNMTTMPLPGNLAYGRTVKYDAWNRLTEAYVTSSGSIRLKCEYDGLNRRIQTGPMLSIQKPAMHLFYNASWQVLETRWSTTQPSPENIQPYYQYVWSARYVDAPVLRDKNSDTDGLCDDQRLYYLTDANFNVSTLVDTGGDPLERYLYDPYGKVTIYTGDWSEIRSTTSYQNDLFYTGRQRDYATLFYDYRHRPYHAELARFLSRDPIGYVAGDANLCRYVRGRPGIAVDPSGLRILEERPKVTLDDIELESIPELSQILSRSSGEM